MKLDFRYFQGVILILNMAETFRFIADKLRDQDLNLHSCENLKSRTSAGRCGSEFCL